MRKHIRMLKNNGMIIVLAIEFVPIVANEVEGGCNDGHYNVSWWVVPVERHLP